MDEDQILQSIIADPDVVDPTIDVSKLRKTTPTSPRLLGNVSGIAGLRFDPTRTDYVRDLYSVYGGGLPTIDVAPVVDTTTPTVDTTTPTVNIGGGGGTNQVASGGEITPTETITQPSFDDQFQSIEDIGTPIDVGFGEGQVDPGLVAGLEGPIIDTSPITPTITSPSGDVFAVDDPLAEEKIDFTPETQGLVDQAFSKVGSTASDIMNDLSQIPGAIADFANQTVDIAGQKINVGATLLRAGVNKLAGGPISLVFDAIGALGLEGGRGDLSDALGEKYGMDDIGRLTGGPMAGYSVGPNHAQTVQDRIDNIKNRTAPQTEASKKKIAELEAYKGEVIATGSSGVITEPGTVVGPGEMPVTQDEIDAFNAPPADINIFDEVALTGLPEPEITADEGFQDIDFGEPEVTADSGFGQADQGEAGSDAGFGQADQGEVGSDAGFSDTGPDYSGVTTGGPPSRGGSAGGPPSQGGGGGGGGKIVCTMMNNSYGFGSFRNKIWLRHSKDLAPEYQIGYHKIFLPLVRLSKTNKLLKKTLEHIAVHRTIDIRQEARGKVHLLGRVYRKILEPICYIVGKYAKR